MKKALNVLGNVLITLVVIFAVVITATVILSTRSEYGVPSLFGYAFLNVQSDSMESEEGFYTGDMIVVRLLTKEEANNCKVGDVLTFRRYFNEQQFLETHRVVEDTYETQYAHEVVDGIRTHGDHKCYVMKGDNTPGIDMLNGGTEIDYATYNNIIGIWEGTSIPKIGKAMDFLKSSTGFMVCIVIPVALFFIYELYIFIMTLTRRQKEKALEEVADKEAELKAKAVAEFLAQQQANGGAATPPAENTAPAAPVGDGSPVPQEPQNPTPADSPAQTPAPDISQVSEDEKQRIIQEYLAKQQNKEE